MAMLSDTVVYLIPPDGYVTLFAAQYQPRFSRDFGSGLEDVRMDRLRGAPFVLRKRFVKSMLQGWRDWIGRT